MTRCGVVVTPERPRRAAAAAAPPYPADVARLLHKQRLQLQAQQQREAWVGLLAEAEVAAARVEFLVERVRQAAANLRRQPLALAAAVAFALVVRPRGVLRWVQRGWLLYLARRRLLRGLAGLLARLRGSGI